MYDLVRPHMVEEPILEIRQGRHLLFEKIMGYGRYVMNDTYIRGGEWNGEDCSMVGCRCGVARSITAEAQLVVTGANGSGKSAYGKQVSRRPSCGVVADGRLP